MTTQSWLLVAIISPVAVALLIPIARWALKVLAQAIVNEINGQLGLQALREQVEANQDRIEQLFAEG